MPIDSNIALNSFRQPTPAGQAYAAGQQAYGRDIANQTSGLALAQQKLAAVGDLLYNVTPENYTTRRQIGINSGIFSPEQVPQNYDPAFIQNVQATHQQAMQQLDAQAQQAKIQNEGAQANMYNAHAQYFTGGGAQGGAGGATGQLIQKYMDATGADFPTAFNIIKSNGAAMPPSMGAPGVPGSQTSQTPQATGEDYLSALPPQTSAQVKALAEGRMQFPSGAALKSPYWQQMLTNVSQYDPNFDAVNYNSRAKTRSDFTSGKSAQNITALNTAMTHLGALSDNLGSLNNTDYPTVNAVKNYLGNQVGNANIQDATSKVGTDAIAVSHELAKVFRSTGMSEGEIKEWEQKINTSNSPTQSKAVVNSALELMNGRVNALGQQYNQGMGTTKDPLELLSPAAQKAYQKLTGAPQDKVSVAQEPITAANPSYTGKPNAKRSPAVVDYKEYFR